MINNTIFKIFYIFGVMCELCLVIHLIIYDITYKGEDILSLNTEEHNKTIRERVKKIFPRWVGITVSVLFWVTITNLIFIK